MRTTKLLLVAVLLVLVPDACFALQARKIDGQSHIDEQPQSTNWNVDEINGQSSVGLKGIAPNVSVRRIDGQSTLEASQINCTLFTIAEIDGQSVVIAAARQIDIGKMNGQSTIIVTIAAGGSLRYGELDGNSRILWRKAHPSDPAPNVTGGKINGRSVVRELK